MDVKEELNTLLSNHFFPDEVKGFVTQPLSGNGQNFTSTIEKVKVFLENDNKLSQIDLIAKIILSNENEMEANSKLKFEKEIDFYRIALPEYQKIQARNKVTEQNIFPLFYTASEKIILLQDLQSDGYYIPGSFLGEEQCKAVLQELAKFHATGIALKQTRPKLFEEELASVVIPALRNSSNPDRDKINMEFRSEVDRLLRASLDDDLRDIAEAVDLLLCKIDEAKLPTPREPFSTLLHNDLWSGNIMFKNPSINDELLDVKFIDFQTVIFNSPARDLIYFLFSSVEVGVLCKFSDLLKLYHLNLLNYLSGLGVDLSVFTFDELMFEVNCYGPTKFKHILLLFKAMSSVDVGESCFEKHLQRVVTLFKEREWL